MSEVTCLCADVRDYWARGPDPITTLVAQSRRLIAPKLHCAEDIGCGGESNGIAKAIKFSDGDATG